MSVQWVGGCWDWGGESWRLRSESVGVEKVVSAGSNIAEEQVG